MVAEHVGRDAAEPEDDERAEDRLVHDADQHLDAVGDHRLDQHPAQVSAEPPGQLGVPAPDIVLAAQVEQDRPGVALVDQAGDVGLHHDRTAVQLARRRDGAVEAGRLERRHQVDPVAGEQVGDLVGREPAAEVLPGQEPGHDLPRVVLPDAAELGDRARGAGPPGAVAGRVAERAGRALRVQVGRYRLAGRRPAGRRRGPRPRAPGRRRRSRLTDSCWSSMTATSGLASFAVRMAGARRPSAVGTVIAMTASTPSSLATRSRQDRNARWLTAAVVSTGPATAAPRAAACAAAAGWLRTASRP